MLATLIATAAAHADTPLLVVDAAQPVDAELLADKDLLGRCSADLADVARSQGAQLLGPTRRDFLLAGDQRSYRLVLPTDGCMHVAAVGQRNIQDLELAVFDPSGRKLTAGRGPTAHPYASFCGRAGRSVVAHLTMLDGDGEIELSTFGGGPRRLRGLDEAATACESSGSPRPSPLDMGEEPDGPTLEQGLYRARRELAELGYREATPMTFGALTEQRREARRLELPADRCFALVALGSSTVGDVDLRVFAPHGDEQAVASDLTRRRDAIVKLCTDEGGAYLLDVRMFRGSGTYVVKSFALDERDARPRGVRGGARIDYAELASSMAQRGLSPQPLGWSLVRPQLADRTALPLRAGECYALGAIGSDELPSTAVELSLLDDRGRVVASRQGASAQPLLFHCAERSATYRAVANSHELRRPGRYMLVLGKAAAENAAFDEAAPEASLDKAAPEASP